jgi:hypothetical protein
LARPWQYDLELSEKPGLRLDIDAAAMLFYDDVVAHRKTEPSTFARGLGREERLRQPSATAATCTSEAGLVALAPPITPRAA